MRERANDVQEEPYLHRAARNYARCMVPVDLIPADLPVPEEIRVGLDDLRCTIAAVYARLATQPVSTKKLRSDELSCRKAIHACLAVLWGFGKVGEFADSPGGPVFLVEIAALRTVTAKRAKALSPPLATLAQVGLTIEGFGETEVPRTGDLPQTGKVALRFAGPPDRSEGFFRALKHFAGRLEATRGEDELMAFARADFRVLDPGFSVGPGAYTEAEALRTMDPQTAALWRDFTSYTTEHYPAYKRAFRNPEPRSRRWCADYSTRGKLYGTWRVTADEGGLTTQMGMSPQGRAYVLEHLGELPDGIQEMFLTSIRCTSCVNCGGHQVFRHGDHEHKLCRFTLFYTPPLAAGDIPWIEHLLDIHLAYRR